MQKQASENIRYLLWKTNVSPEEWENRLARYLSCEVEHARKLLLGELEIDLQEIELLADKWGYKTDILLYSPLVQEEVANILTRNLKYIFDSLDRGMKTTLASHLHIHPTTISRWCAGENKPTEQNLKALKAYLGISQSIDLNTDPLFLSLSPISDQSRRQWLHKRIEKLSKEELVRLFPALEKLLG